MLGPEMRSTGEVMGIDAYFGTAYAKSQEAAFGGLPTKGRVFVSVAEVLRGLAARPVSVREMSRRLRDSATPNPASNSDTSLRRGW